MPRGSIMLRAASAITVSTAFLVYCVTSALGTLGCGPADSVPPVATPDVGLNRTRVPMGGPLRMTYRFTVDEDAPEFADDYRVFVHFLDADGALMFGDDHTPPAPTASWRRGQEIAYERLMIVPVYPYVGEVTIATGLYSPATGDRLPLAGEHLGQRAYLVATVEMAPQSVSELLVFEDGWYQAESVPEEPDREWQWTTGRATISFRNPRADSTLYLEVGARPDLFDTPQTLTLKIDDSVVETLEMASDGPTHHTVSVPAASLGDAGTVALTLNVDQTFVPSIATNGENPDERELGVQVFYAFLELD